MYIKPQPPLFNLPTYYSECETYEEQLQWLLNQLNTLADTVESISKSVNDYTDDEIKKLQEEITEKLNAMNKKVTEELENFRKSFEKKFENLDTEIEDIKTDINDKYHYLLVYINSELEKIRAEILALEIKLNENISKASKNTLDSAKIYTNIVKQDLQVKIAKVDKKIDEILKKFPKVYNPTLGDESDLQITINDLYQYLRSHGITAEKLDALQITAGEFDLLLQRALQFDVDFGTYALDTNNYMYNPFSGKKEAVKDVVYAISDAIDINGKTAKEIDGSEKTASEIDGTDINAYTFDWYKNLTDLSDKFVNKKIETYKQIPLEESGVFLFNQTFEKPLEIVGLIIKGHFGSESSKYDLEQRLTFEGLKKGNTNIQQTIEFSRVENDSVTIVTRKILLVGNFDAENENLLVSLQGLLQPTNTYIKDTDGEHYYSDSDGENYSLIVTSVEIISPHETIKEIN